MKLTSSSQCLLQIVNTIFSPLKKLFHAALLTVLIAFAAILTYPILFTVFVPVLVYRKLVASFVQRCDSKCGRMLSGLDAVMTGRNVYSKPLITLSPYFTFNEKIERSHIVKVINEQVVKPNVFPNLKQKIVRKFGYYFWYPVDNFNVEHHVTYLDPKCPDAPVNKTTLRRLGADKIGRLPFDPNRSPWELVLVPNLVDENNPMVKSGIYIRVNHCLMDGYALVSFCQKVASKPWKIDVASALNNKQTNSSGANTLIKQFGILLKVLVTGPYHFIYGVWFLKDNSEFLNEALATSEKKTWVLKSVEPRKIDGVRLKKLRKPLNSSVSSLLISAVSEGIINFMKRRYDEGLCEKLPKRICLHMSFPLPGHSGKLKNHWTAVRIPISVNKDSDPMITLKSIDEHYQNYKTSVVPLVNFVSSQFFGTLPIFLYPDFEKLVTHTIVLANFPGPAGKVDLFGYDWEGISVSGCPADGAVFAVTCQSFHGKFWIDVGGVTSVLRNQQDCNDLEDHVYDVFNKLEGSVMSKSSCADAVNGNSL